MDYGHSHGSHEALTGWDLRHPRLVIYPHVPIILGFYRHALSHFVLSQVETCGALTSIFQTIYKKCSDNPLSLLSESQIRRKTNLTYQSPVQWSITKDLLFMAHLLFCALCWLSLAVADATSSMWASLYKQASICQRCASIFKVVFLFALMFYICYLFWWNENVALTRVGCWI